MDLRYLLEQQFYARNLWGQFSEVVLLVVWLY